MSEYIFGPSEETLPFDDAFFKTQQSRLDGGFDRRIPLLQKEVAAKKILSLELSLFDITTQEKLNI